MNLRTRLLATSTVLFALGCGDDDSVSSGTGGGTGLQQGTRIEIADGAVQGDTDGGTRRFRGIPHAAPPVGELRWKPPQPVAAWQDTRDALDWGGRCAQTDSLQALPSENEDCLYLNVWSPDPAPADPRPVMVWFHGGGNQNGSSSDEVPLGVGGFFYDGRVLAETRDVVVVSANYRVGVFGFFAHAALSAEGGQHASGNQGLLDQRSALEWVQKNIAAFGGDPGQVTIFGESAGSFDVCFHQVSPGSIGLFHRAISQSGGCTQYVTPLAQAELAAESFVGAVGCDGVSDPLECLRDKPVADLLIPAPVDGAEPDLPGGSRYAGGTPRWGFNPIVDGAVLPDQPRALFDSKKFAKVPYLIGSNSDEGTLFHIGAAPVTTEAEYVAALEREFGASAPAIAERYPVSDFASPNDALMRVTGDASLVCGTYDTARRAAAGGADVYLYNFAQPIPLAALESLNLGATHGAEIAYVFGSVDPANPAAKALGEAIRGYWTRFADSGDPNGESAVEWPRWTDAADLRINFDADITVIERFRRELCEFWGTLYDARFP